MLGAERRVAFVQVSGGCGAVEVERRVWDSNPRGRVNALAVFKTAAIGH